MNVINDIGFLTESELKERTTHAPTALFGAGYFAEKTLNLMAHPPALMVDNNPKKIGTEMDGVPIKDPQALKAFIEGHPDGLLILCVQKYTEVIEQLAGMKLLDPSRIFITPVARELVVIDQIREHDATLLFSNYDSEGGLYLYQIRTGELRKLGLGSVRGFVRVRDKLYYVSYAGLHCLDAHTFEPQQGLEFDEYDFCGLIYDEAEGHLIIGDTQSDKIIFVNEQDLTIAKQVSLSDKFERFGKEFHHVNDLVNVGDFILASVFSVHGWWRYGLYDGGIVEINKHTLELRQIPIKECWFPHSIRLHNGRLYILDSMNGSLLQDMRDEVFCADGFLRGLEFNGDYCYIGQSLHRHVSRLTARRTVSADCGIHLFNMKSRLRRFISMPDMTNIYQIMKVDWL